MARRRRQVASGKDSGWSLWPGVGARGGSAGVRGEWLGRGSRRVGWLGPRSMSTAGCATLRIGAPATHPCSCAASYNRAMSTPLPPPPLSPRHWPAWLGVGMLWCLARLPWSVQRALGRGIGRLLPLLLQRRDRVVRRNLEWCFPELTPEARERLRRDSYASLGLGAFEFARA